MSTWLRKSILSGSLICLLLIPARQSAADDYDQCLVGLMKSMSGTTTLAEVREICASQRPAETEHIKPTSGQSDGSALDKRLALESATEDIPFVMTPHKPNYIIVTHNARRYEDAIFEKQFRQAVSFNNREVDFQISLKFLLASHLLNNQADLYFAYTNRSFWQVFDNRNSAPFRETNHEPEAWLQIRTHRKLFGFTNQLVQLGIVHQSNGRGGALSRSWNRLYANLVFEKEHFYFGIKPWYRIPEKKSDDDNPDIEDFLGYMEFQGVYKRNKNNFGLFFRDNLRKDNRGTLQLDWSFPLFSRWRGYVQYFYGYGESLIDYNNKVNKLGIGIKLSDWL